MKTPKNALQLILLSALSLMFCFCSKEDAGPKDDTTDGNNVDITPSVDVDLPTDEGEIGFVVDAREIFRKGYFPTEAIVVFQDYTEFNTALEIDAITSFAILHIPNEDLTAAQQDAMHEGVAVEINIFDQDGQLLATYESINQKLNDSNSEIIIETALPMSISDIALKADVGYLLQMENTPGVVSSTASDSYSIGNFVTDTIIQPFYFTAVNGKQDTYTIGHLGYEEGTQMYISSEGWVNLGGGAVALPPGGAQEFLLQQQEDGWLTIANADTPADHLRLTDINTLEFSPDLPYQRFRLITDDISWHAADQGVKYSDPVMPPTELDFAYQATIRNCTSGILTETVGNSQSRTSSSTVSTSETLQLFDSVEGSFSATVGLEVGGELYGATGSVEATVSASLTTSSTAISEQTNSATSSETTEVSRTRELQVQPFSGVEVYDAIRIVKNVRIPFTQVIRISGTYKSNGASLTGAEILSQLVYNFSGGIPVAVEADYVDVSIRGSATIDQMFETETGAKQINDACN